MARTQTLSFMRTRALRIADMETSGFVGTTEANDAINSAIAEVWDLLVNTNPTEMYSKDGSISTVTGTTAYSLPSDFLNAIAVYAVDSTTGTQRPVDPVNNYDRGYMRAPQSTYTITLEYNPVATILVNDSDTFDGVNGYEELVIALAARNFLIKEESDIGAVQQNINEMRARIGSFKRTRGPRMLTDVSATDVRIYPATLGVRGYRIRAGNIELFESILPLLAWP